MLIFFLKIISFSYEIFWCLSDLYPKLKITNPDPANNLGSDRIRIHYTDWYVTYLSFTNILQNHMKNVYLSYIFGGLQGMQYCTVPVHYGTVLNLFGILQLNLIKLRWMKGNVPVQLGTLPDFFGILKLFFIKLR